LSSSWWEALPWRGTDIRASLPISNFLIRPDLENAELVVRTLREFGFGALGIASGDLCLPDQILQLGVKPNRIDLITSVAGLTFDEAWESRVPGTTDSVSVLFIGRDALIRNKEAAARPQDLADAHALRQRRK